MTKEQLKCGLLLPIILTITYNLFLSLKARLLPNGRPVAWGALVASVGDQSFVQGARTGA